MKKKCLVCLKEKVFDNSWDEDTIRCSNCGSLPYSEVNEIVLEHRRKYKFVTKGII